MAKRCPVVRFNQAMQQKPVSQGIGSIGAAKDSGLFEFAIELVNKTPADPRTLIRAARDYATKHPAFALAAGMAGLRYIIEGYGYDITSVDVLEACSALMQAADAANIGAATVNADVRALIAANLNGDDFVQKVLARQWAQ